MRETEMIRLNLLYIFHFFLTYSIKMERFTNFILEFEQCAWNMHGCDNDATCIEIDQDNLPSGKLIQCTDLCMRYSL